MNANYQRIRVLQKLCPPARRRWLQAVAFAALLLTGYAADTFTVASFNVENYLLEPAGTRPAKSPESRSAVQRTLLTLRADVVALQEIGGIGALEELRRALRAGGLEYPYSELVGGYDTNIQVAVLSRLPILERRPHTNEGFLLRGRRFRTTRGIAELELQVTPHYRVTLINVHLKSQRETAEAAEDEIREQESLILRKLVDRRLRSDPAANLILVGDLNDLKNSMPLRTLLGRGATALHDARPFERRSFPGPGAERPSGSGERQVTWTHYYAKEDVYSRLDYLLISSGLKREYLPQQSCVFAPADWGVASDHRAIIATFLSRDR